MSQLAEVREPDASAAVAAIYADIKQSAGLPQVNLIFRYFATKPGVLEWIWTALRPLYRSSELMVSARALTSAIERLGPSPLPDALRPHEYVACKTVLDAYNSGNSQNLIGLTALLRALGCQPVTVSPSQAATMPVLTPRTLTAEPVAAFPFPALPRRDELAADVAGRIEKMAARHPGAVPGVIPSLYLHLALWPAALKAADLYLQPIIEAPDWVARVARVIDQAGAAADQLSGAIELPADPPDPLVLADVTATVEAFIGNTIPDLTTVGRLLAIR